MKHFLLCALVFVSSLNGMDGSYSSGDGNDGSSYSDSQSDSGEEVSDAVDDNNGGGELQDVLLDGSDDDEDDVEDALAVRLPQQRRKRSRKKTWLKQTGLVLGSLLLAAASQGYAGVSLYKMGQLDSDCCNVDLHVDLPDVPNVHNTSGPPSFHYTGPFFTWYSDTDKLATQEAAEKICVNNMHTTLCKPGEAEKRCGSDCECTSDINLWCRGYARPRTDCLSARNITDRVISGSRDFDWESAEWHQARLNNTTVGECMLLSGNCIDPDPLFVEEPCARPGRRDTKMRPTEANTNYCIGKRAVQIASAVSGFVGVCASHMMGCYIGRSLERK